MTNTYNYQVNGKRLDQKRKKQHPRFGNDVKSTQQHPPNRYSFNKTVKYHQQMQNDLDKLLQEDQLESPRWAIEAANNAGRAKIFQKQFLAASKIEQHLEDMSSQRTSTFPQGSRPVSSESTSSKRSSIKYKPNSAHQYLTDTMLRDDGEIETEYKLGRPTRTTLLRAKQRCMSAPINSFEFYKAENKHSSKRPDRVNERVDKMYSGLNEKLKLATNGQSAHSFLIGARYNRTHYYDAKSVTDHGLYMPRSNPHGAFLMRPSSANSKNSDEIPPPEEENSENGEIKSAAPIDYADLQKNGNDGEHTWSEPSLSRKESRPKSSKFRSRPKTAAISVERKPYETSTINITMPDQSAINTKSNFKSAKVSCETKVKSRSKYFSGVNVQGKSVSNGTEKIDKASEFRQRPKSCTVRKTNVTVKDISYQLRKEHILTNSSPSIDKNHVFDGSILLSSYKRNIEQWNEDQRSCPSPTELPNFQNYHNIIEEISPDEGFDQTLLRSSMHMVGSAKCRNVHVRFADDLASPQNDNDACVEESPAAMSAEAEEPLSDGDEHNNEYNVKYCGSLEFKEVLDYQRENTFPEEDLFIEDDVKDFHSELDPPENDDGDRLSSEMVRPISRIGEQIDHGIADYESGNEEIGEAVEEQLTETGLSQRKEEPCSQRLYDSSDVEDDNFQSTFRVSINYQKNNYGSEGP